MAKSEFTKKERRGFRTELIGQMLKLATSGFGLVSALAWNELIKKLVGDYIRPVVGGASEIVSLLVYAIVVTFLAVFITYNLTKLVKLEQKKKK